MSRDGNSELDRAFAAQGLARMGPAAKTLGVTREVLDFLIDQRQLKPVDVRWKDHTVRGIPLSQLEGRQAVYRDGTVRLVDA